MNDCRYGKVDNYQHSGLPHGKDLTRDTLRSALHEVLLPFAEKNTNNITCGSKQANESLNNVLWSKTPKCRNYNMSESFDYRCAASVLQLMRECYTYVPFALKLYHHEMKHNHIVHDGTNADNITNFTNSRASNKNNKVYF